MDIPEVRPEEITWKETKRDEVFPGMPGIRPLYGDPYLASVGVTAGGYKRLVSHQFIRVGGRLYMVVEDSMTSAYPGDFEARLTLVPAQEG